MEGEDLARYEYESDDKDDIPPEEFVKLLPTPGEFEEFMRRHWEWLRAAGVPLKWYAVSSGHDEEEEHPYGFAVFRIIHAPTIEHAIVAFEYENLREYPIGYFEDNPKLRNPGRNRARVPITPPELIALLLAGFDNNRNVHIEEVSRPPPLPALDTTPTARAVIRSHRSRPSTPARPPLRIASVTAASCSERFDRGRRPWCAALI